MKLTILGCQSPYPGPGGATPGYLLQAGKTNLLIDCGSGVFAQLEKHLHFNEIHAVLYSHLHNDHIADHFILQYAVHISAIHGERNGQMLVYAPNQPADMHTRLQYSGRFKIRDINGNLRLEIGGIRISFFRTDHGVPCFAMKFEYDGKVFVYGADSGPNTDWSPFGKGADLLMLEASYMHKDKPAKPIGHLSSKEAGEAAEKMGCKHLILTHLYPKFNPDDLVREAADYYSGRIEAARIGDVYTLLP